MTTDTYRPIEVDEEILRSLKYEEVFIVDRTDVSPQYPRKYFRNMVPDVAIIMCDNCYKFFLQDEYEFAYLEKECCPFCRAKTKKDKDKKSF